MRSVRTATVIALLGQLALLTALAVTVGLSGFGWVVGITCGVVTNATLARALSRAGADALNVADRVTLVRATLVGGVAALIVSSLGQPAPDALVGITVVALILDAVDGWVARRTGTVSAVGARFDMEVDAFLILVLSVYVVGLAGWWVLAIGLARYAFGVAGTLLPWMTAPSPPRYWCKVVAAVQGVVLTVAMADILPHAVTKAALGGCLRAACRVLRPRGVVAVAPSPRRAET